MYKKAAQLKLRFETSRGSLSAENLWDLSMNQLAAIIRNLRKKISANAPDDLAFLDDTASQTDPIEQLRFDIVKDIYLTKKADREAAKQEAEKKIHNQKILSLIKEKQDENLKNLSVEDLEKMLKE